MNYDPQFIVPAWCVIGTICAALFAWSWRGKGKCACSLGCGAELDAKEGKPWRQGETICGDCETKIRGQANES